MTRRIKPTDAELAILQVLWDHGELTVRQVHEHLGEATGYTTVLKLMQIMAEKSLVKRDTSQRSHVYRAAVSRARVQKQLVAELVDKAFGGSAADLALQALRGKPASEEELDAIRAWLDAEEEEA